MPPELYAYRPIAITTRKRHSWKPYSTRHSRTTRSLPIFPFDFTQAPTRKFASQPDVSVNELESEMRRMSLTPVGDSMLAEERRKFEDEKKRFEAEKRELENRVRVAEHKAAGRHRRCEELRAEVFDLRQELEEAQDFCLKVVQGLNLQEDRIAQKDQTIAKRDSYIASLIEDGRTIIQQKDREIAALKVQSAPEAVRPQYPIQPQQYPSQYFSPYAPSSQDEQYDPSRPQFVPCHPHPARAYPQQPVYSQQVPSSQGDGYRQPHSYHGHAPSGYPSQAAPAQDVSMDWSSEGSSVQTDSIDARKTQTFSTGTLQGVGKAVHRAAIEQIFMQPNWRWWMVGIKVLRRCMWVYEDEPEILKSINEQVGNVSEQMNEEAERFRLQVFAPYMKRKMEEKLMRSGGLFALP